MAILRSIRAAILFAIAALACGCSNIDGLKANLETGSVSLAEGPHPQDEPVALGKLHYERGEYGLAEENFRKAVEANPKSTDGWLGLAAAYDQLRRFDLADRAYGELLSRAGRTPVVLNNMGYHYMLMNNLSRARELLTEASKLDPNNPSIQGNLQLLETWKSGA